MRVGTAVLAVLLLSCGTSSGPIPGVQVLMDFQRAGGFFTAPFPSEDLRRADDTIDIAGFPNPQQNLLVDSIRGEVAGSARGFGITAGIFFQLSAAIDPARLPGLSPSTDAGSPVLLVSVDPVSPDRGRRYPLHVSFSAGASVFAPPNLLALVPLQGIPLRPGATYAAVIRRSLTEPPLGVSAEMAALVAGDRPASLGEPAFAAYRAALAELVSQGVPDDDIAGIAVFRTDDPIAGLLRFRDHALSLPAPTALEPFALLETYDDYCVYRATVDMPDYQTGTPPFRLQGGTWSVDPVVQRQAASRVFVTVPRRATPTAGFPTVVFVRAGGGGDRPLVDRGPRAQAGGPDTPGTGLARLFARAGWAGVQVDGPNGGLRNPQNDDEQFTLFNLQNPPALRDNIRQSALELSVIARALPSWSFDAGDCPGAVDARFDGDRLALFGHSTGATIGGIAAAIEPRYRAAMFSGFGGSYIENLLYKQRPLDARAFAMLILGETDLHVGSPILSLLQWAAEPADPPAYAPLLRGQRHVLMMQGIVDHYIPPRIANAASLSLGLGLAGSPLDGNIPDVPDQLALVPLLSFSGASTFTYPVTGASIGVVSQHREDGIEDGHEVVFQTEAPKHQLRCFLLGLAGGAPQVVAPGPLEAPCE